MEATYKNIWILFTAIFAGILWGFYRTYFGLFPTFENITTAQHFHGILFLLWFALLFVQPFLIKQGNVKLHKLLGNFSYLLVPLIILSTLAVAKGQYQRELMQFSQSQAVASLILPLPQVMIFAALYLIAVFNTKNTPYHLRYIIITSLVLIGPGLGRALIIWVGMPFPQGVILSFLITDLVLIGLLVYERFHRQVYKPYLVGLTLLLFSHLAWYFLPDTLLWQIVCGRFVQVFF